LGKKHRDGGRSYFGVLLVVERVVEYCGQRAECLKLGWHNCEGGYRSRTEEGIGGASGVLLKSKGPLRTASAEMRGFMRDGRRRFSVVCACSINRNHRYIGKAGPGLRVQRLLGF